jgi:hypothetical protein
VSVCHNENQKKISVEHEKVVIDIQKKYRDDLSIQVVSVQPGNIYCDAGSLGDARNVVN